MGANRLMMARPPIKNPSSTRDVGRGIAFSDSANVREIKRAENRARYRRIGSGQTRLDFMPPAKAAPAAISPKPNGIAAPKYQGRLIFKGIRLLVVTGVPCLIRRTSSADCTGSINAVAIVAVQTG